MCTRAAKIVLPRVFIFPAGVKGRSRRGAVGQVSCQCCTQTNPALYSSKEFGFKMMDGFAFDSS